MLITFKLRPAEARTGKIFRRACKGRRRRRHPSRADGAERRCHLPGGLLDWPAFKPFSQESLLMNLRKPFSLLFLLLLAATWGLAQSTASSGQSVDQSTTT